MQANEVFFGFFQAAFGLLFAVAKARNAGGFFKNLAAVFAFCGDDTINLALPDDGIAVAAEAGIHKQLMHVAQTYERFVNAVFTFAGAVKTARNGNGVAVVIQLAVGVIHGDGHFAKALRFALRCAAEDDVLHFGAAQCAGRLLAEYPTHGIADVAFAAAVWADDRRDAVFKF